MDYLKSLSSRLSKVVAVRRRRPTRKQIRASNPSLKLHTTSNSGHQPLGPSVSSPMFDPRVGCCCADEMSDADRSPCSISRVHRDNGRERVGQHEAGTKALARSAVTVCRRRSSTKNVAQIMHGLDKLVQLHVSRMGGQTPVASPTATQMLQYVTLIDATGREHPILMQCCTSYEQLQTIITVSLTGRSVGALVQKRYFDAGLYDLCIDQGAKVVQVTNDVDKWPTIDSGTKLIMRVIFQQKQRSCKVCECCVCGASNRLDCQEVTDWSGWLTEGSIDCQTCGARFQISLEKKNGKKGAGIVPDLDDETRGCIRNYRINAIKQVAFCADGSHEVHEADEWDRTPAPVVQRLSYGDLLEMKMLQRDLYQAPQLQSDRPNVLLPRVPIPLLRLNP